ncbi:MAG: AsmA-like C-terminal region-containing protein [Bacteroidales bacterium]
MKLVFKILGILIAVILLLMVAIPYFFRDQIAEKVKEEINKNLNAQVDFSDFSLSLFRSFPDFNFRLEGLSVVNNVPFEGDTLAYIPAFGLTLDLMSVFRGETYELKRVNLEEPVVNLLVTEAGVANWDVALPSEEEPETTADTGTSFAIELNNVSIDNGRLIYHDKSIVTYVLLEGLDHELSGDFTLDFTTLKTHTTIDSLTVQYDGINYLDEVNTELDADIDADLANYIFTLKKNELRLNELLIAFDGSVGMQENDDINLMLTYSARQSEFRHFLSLVPAIYAKDFGDIETSGQLTLNGNVKGIYNESNYPAFALNILVDNGRFKYPDLPQSVENIDVNARVNFPGGSDLDRLVVEVPTFNFTMAGNPVSANLTMKTPMSDPDLKGEVNGKLDLSQVDEVYPLDEGEQLSGLITANVSFDGSMSMLENENYDAFTMMGTVLVQELNYSSEMLRVPVAINRAQLNFSPEYLDLVNFNMKLGESDMSASGRIEQFLPYAMADGTLVGSLQTSSEYFNVSALIPESEETAEEPADTAAMEVVEIPPKIDFTMNSTFDRLMYDDIEFKNVNGTVKVQNQALVLDQLNLDVLDGSIAMSGAYDTKPAQPHADFNIQLAGMGIQEAYQTFGPVEKLMPIADNTSGNFASSFSIETVLGSDMMPVYPSMNGGGSLSTTDIIVDNVNTMNKIADALKMPDLKRLKLTPVDLSFEIVEGKVFVNPFDIKYENITATLGGWTSFDQTIDYNMVLSVPRQMFGGAANNVLENMMDEANKLGTDFSLGEMVKINIDIGGTVSDPEIRTVLGKGTVQDLKERAKEEIKERVEEEIEEKREEVREEAQQILNNAEQEAQKIINEAQKQADAIMKATRQSADQVKAEADKQAQRLIDEAEGKGTLAQIGAKTAANKLREQAEQKSEKLIEEADKRADRIVQEAREQAEKIKQQAQQRVDDL